jgi:hypothetical protein
MKRGVDIYEPDYNRLLVIDEKVRRKKPLGFNG